MGVNQIIILSLECGVRNLLELDNYIAWSMTLSFISLVCKSQNRCLRETGLHLNVHFGFICSLCASIVHQSKSLVRNLLKASIVQFIQSALESYYDVLWCWVNLGAGSSERITKHRTILILAVIFKLFSEWVHCAKDFVEYFERVATISIPADDASVRAWDTLL